MGELLKNVKVAAAAGAAICGLVLFGVAELSPEGAAALNGFVVVAGPVAFAAAAAFFAKKVGAKKDDEAAK